MLVIASMIPSTVVQAVETNRSANLDQSEQSMSASAPTLAAPGRTADAGTGLVGQRQTRDEAASNIKPLNRINNRVANRVQNRIRNRIDRYYDPQANATSPFKIADQ